MDTSVSSEIGKFSNLSAKYLYLKLNFQPLRPVTTTRVRQLGLAVDIHTFVRVCM